MQLGSIGTLLTVAIGFTVVMLLLSLVVTGLSQALQSLFRLRGRATRETLRIQLIEMSHASAIRASVMADNAVGMRAASRAGSPAGARLSRVASRAMNWAMGPPQRMIYPDKLQEMGIPEEEHARFNATVTDRFTRWMRWLTLACALFIAFTFQVNATKVLADLSTDPALRAKALEIAERRLNEAPTSDDIEAKTAAPAVSFTEQNESAIAEVARKLPQVAEALEQVSGRAVDRADAVAELATIFQEHPARDAALKEYDAAISSIQGRRAPKTSSPKPAQDELAMINIGFWSKGSTFYWTTEPTSWNWTNLIGVLITAVLISLGAPFWYDRLRELNVLRDSLYPKQKAEKAEALAGADVQPAAAALSSTSGSSRPPPRLRSKTPSPGWKAPAKSA